MKCSMRHFIPFLMSLTINVTFAQVELWVGDDLGTEVAKYGSGTSFLIHSYQNDPQHTPGIHRNQLIIPKDNMQFHGDLGPNHELLSIRSKLT
jgi:hypothetical protein